MPKSLTLAENWLNCQEKASFLLILTKYVEPIFQSPGPILRHTALEGMLLTKVNQQGHEKNQLLTEDTQ